MKELLILSAAGLAIGVAGAAVGMPLWVIALVSGFVGWRMNS
jgi:hypothetical protein